MVVSNRSRSRRCRFGAATTGGRFGSPLVLSRVHWVRPEMVVQVSYVEMTPDGLLRHVVYLGEREDKAARDVHRDWPEDGREPHASSCRAYDFDILHW